MAFAVVRLASADDPRDPHYPVPGGARDARDAIRLEPQDGPVRSVRISSIRVADVSDGRARTLTDLPEVRASLHITHARVALASSSASTLTDWFRTLSGNGTPSMLAGHLRYEWVTSVHARVGSAWLVPNSLAIGFRDPVGPGFGSLTVTVTRRVRALAVARAIAGLAAYAQSRAAGVPDTARTALESYAADPRAATSGGFVRFTLPRG